MTVERNDTGMGESRFAEHDPRPVVNLPREGLPGIAIAAVGIVLALGLFLVMDGRRQSQAEHSSQAQNSGTGAIGSPQPLDVPDTRSPAFRYVMLDPMSPPPALVLRPKPSPASAPMRETGPAAPSPALPPPPLYPTLPPVIVGPPFPPIASHEDAALIIDGGVLVAADGQEPANAAPQARPSGNGENAKDASPTAVRPTRIARRTMVVPAGTLIPAVLETPIDTARPGMVRAIVSKNARGFDGRRVLVPRGSHLIGEYQSDVRSSQNRVLVTWNTLVLPDGMQIELKSPAADPLGGAGIPGKVHSYFFARFASAVLQTAMTVGANLAARSDNGTVIVALPNGQVGTVIGQELLPTNTLHPKITVKQGAMIKVFVARDLDFTEVSPSSSAPRP